MSKWSVLAVGEVRRFPCRQWDAWGGRASNKLQSKLLCLYSQAQPESIIREAPLCSEYRGLQQLGMLRANDSWVLSHRQDIYTNSYKVQGTTWKHRRGSRKNVRAEDREKDLSSGRAAIASLILRWLCLPTLNLYVTGRVNCQSGIWEDLWSSTPPCCTTDGFQRKDDHCFQLGIKWWVHQVARDSSKHLATQMALVKNQRVTEQNKNLYKGGREGRGGKKIPESWGQE